MAVIIMRHRPITPLLAALVAMTMPTLAETREAVTVITSPNALPPRHDRPRVFLGGSIDMGNADDWQAAMIRALATEKAVVLNPRRTDWNKEWRPNADEPHFRQQVEWELAALDSADIIVMYLAPGSQSPISLLELGLHAKSGKVILLCPDGFWRKGNVDITAARYGIKRVTSMDELVRATRARLAAWTPHASRNRPASAAPAPQAAR